MNCVQCEDRFSDYLEDALQASERDDVDRHLGTCAACTTLLAETRALLGWGAGLPPHPAPEWLPGRILANTPVLVRERWRDTFAAAWGWATVPRRAMTVFASVLVLGWTLNLSGADLSTLVRNPSSLYYGAQGMVYETWDEAVRSWYGSHLVTEIYCRIEQLRETP